MISFPFINVTGLESILSLTVSFLCISVSPADMSGTGKVPTDGAQKAFGTLRRGT